MKTPVLETIREALPRFGVQCDALTGDGLLARPASQSVSPLETVLRALEVEVLGRTGVPVKLGGKTLRGDDDKCSRGRRASPGARYGERLNVQRGNASGKMILRKHFTKPPQRTHQDNKIPDETAILNSPR